MTASSPVPSTARLPLTHGRFARLPRPTPESVLAVVLVVVGAALSAAATVALRPVAVLVGAVVAIGVFAHRPRAALLLFVATIPLEYQFRIGGSDSLTVTKVAGALCLGSFAVHAVLTRRRLYADVTHAIALGLLVLALASSALAQSSSLGVTTSIRYASWALLYAVITQFPGEPVLLRRLGWTLALSAAVAGAIGSINFLTGVTQLASLRYGQQNDFAFVLAAALPVAGWVVLTSRGFARMVALAAAGLITAGIVLSFSRGAWLAVAAAVIIYVALHRRHTLRLIAFGLVAATATSLFITANPRRVQEGVAAKQVVAQQNVDSRLTLYRGAVDLASSHPLLGIGPGNFGNYFYVITGAPAGTPPLLVVHDTYLEVAAELGVPGFLLFMSFLVIAVRRLSGIIRRRAGPPELGALLLASFAANLVGFLTLSEEFFAPVWLAAGLATLLAATP
jgi:O-antigen ligase